jgi:tetratricopeptide (TPR) repeat protein
MALTVKPTRSRSTKKSKPLSPTRTLATPATELRRGTTFAGRFKIIEELGRGGMGTVYLAQDTKIKSAWLWLIRPEIASDSKTVERFGREVKTARRISHRNVCRLYELMEDGGIHFITMECVQGQDVRRIIERSGPLPVVRALGIVRQVCAGLAEAHRIGVVHRDLKPGNIMIDKNGNAKILDFGIARSLSAKGVTAAGAIVGTPEYMSPEQMEGREVDTRSDIYSLGVVLYEMLTSRVPFEGDSALSIALKHKSEIPPDPREINPGLPAGLSAVILKCLAKEKEERYQTVEELLAELNALEGDTEASAVVERPPLPAFLVEEKPPREEEEEEPVFVAREGELARLNAFLERALSGRGQVIFITGEARGGKTALVQEFCRRAQDAHPDLIVAAGKCNAHTGIGDPYSPFVEILGLLAGDVEAKWAAGTINKELARRLWNLIPETARAVVDDGPDLIDIFVPGRRFLARAGMFTHASGDWLFRLKRLVEKKSALPPDSTLQQSNLFEQYTRMLIALASVRPIILFLDDLQWVDAGSASLLFHLGRRVAGHRILIAGAFRSDEVALGRGDGRHPIETVVHEFKRDFGDIQLELGGTESGELVDALIDTEPNHLPRSFRQTFLKLTKGHPLFTVELLRAIKDRDMLIKDQEGRWVESPSLDWNALPARVDAVIEERISRLNEKLRETLTMASVEGEEFTAEVLARLQEVETRKLIRLLSADLDKRHHLVAAKGMRQLDRLNLSLYIFRHILFQRYLYNSLDEVERTHLHAEVGQVLEDLYGERGEEISVQLARHYQEAGIVDKAVSYLQKAGNRAVRLSAGEEAIGHFSKALELLQKLPETPERDLQELSLQLALVVPLLAAKGFGAPELGRAVVRARELCRQIGDARQRFMALVQLATYYATTAQYRTALELREEIKRLAEESKDPMLEVVSYCIRVWPLLNVGELVRADECVQQMAAIYDPKKHGVLAYLFGYDLGVLNLGFGSWAQWILGYPDQALRQLKEAMRIARELDHPHAILVSRRLNGSQDFS